MKTRVSVYIFLLLMVAYGLTVLLIPPSPESLARYNLTETKARLINLSVVIPLLLIWLTALYGFSSLKKYADSIERAKEGNAFTLLANGLMVLAFSLPINSLAGILVRYIRDNHGDYIEFATISRNYLSLLLYLIGYTIIAIGAARLVKEFKAGTTQVALAQGKIAPILITLSALFAWLITSKPFNQGVDERVYYLPSWLLVATIVIPYLLAWRAGMLGTYYLYTFYKNVKGSIYKNAFIDLARGIGVVVFVSILIQFITTSSTQLSRLKLTPVLGLVYFLLLLYAVGFGLVARGAKKLKRIEEV